MGNGNLIMKTIILSLTILFILNFFTTAICFSSSFTGSSLAQSAAVASSKSTLTMEYIPSGMSKEQWAKVKEAEKNKNKGKNLGQTGITSFKSRSFAEWQKGGGKHLYPVDPKKVKDVKEIPYMQRQGGAADDSDIKGNKSGKKKGLFGLFLNMHINEEDGFSRMSRLRIELRLRNCIYVKVLNL